MGAVLSLFLNLFRLFSKQQAANHGTTKRPNLNNNNANIVEGVVAKVSDIKNGEKEKVVADQGSAEGLLNLACLYMQGKGVEQNLQKAVELLLQAVKHPPSELGVVESYCNLGLKYFNGIGVEQSNKQAKRWLGKGALEGHAESELNLGAVLLDEGLYKLAKGYFESAALKGCARAFLNLGNMYCSGLGVRKNIEKAREMYTKAKDYGFSLDVEQELKKHAHQGEDESEVHHRLATSELVFAAITPDTLADLQSKANTSETAKRVWNGWQDYQSAKKMMMPSTPKAKRNFLILLSNAIQKCGHFLDIEEDLQDAVTEIFIEFSASQSKQSFTNDINLAVCAFYGALPQFGVEERSGAFQKSSHLQMRLALAKRELQKKTLALELIHKAIELAPDNVDLIFYKAQIQNSVDTFLNFLALSSKDHYWRPRAYYSIAKLVMEDWNVEMVEFYYKLGLEAEKDQLLMFKFMEMKEKNYVAAYLMGKKIVYSLPSLRKIDYPQRLQLLHHHNREYLEYFEMASEKVDDTFLIRTSFDSQKQPETRKYKELHLGDLDFRKEFIYEGFIEGLIVAPAYKNIGIVTVMEDKKGNTVRLLLYDDISLASVKVGQWIRLHNPYVRIASDKRSALKVTKRSCFELIKFAEICHCCTRTTEELGVKLKRCARCQKTFYCTKLCQTKHWEMFEHKVLCPILA